MDRDYATGLGIGLLAGAALGVIVGFLYAPRSGKETREQIKEKAGEIIGSARERAADAIDNMRERAAEATHKFEQKIAPKA